MFSPQTVFVLGAGASVDLKLPTGDDLREDLMAVLERDGDNDRFKNEQFNHAIRSLCQRLDQNWANQFDAFAKAAVRIRYALPMAVSIDNLLHTHRNDELMVRLGKLAIATVIIEKESQSHLSPQHQSRRGDVDLAVTNTKNMSKSWYLPLMRLLATGRTVEELGSIFENVAFIIFNYDRCLEHFLVNAIMNYFNVNSNIAINTINRLTIIHPYGQVGYFKWQRAANDGVISSYGNSDGRLIEISEQLLTFTESASEGVIEEARNLIRKANTLVLMGFGFLPQNMELLSVTSESQIKRVFVTTKGIGDDDVEIVISEIAQMISRRLHSMYPTRPDTFQPFVERGTCRELMDRHWLRLTRKQ